MKWNTHIAAVVKKANRSLGLIKRGLKEAPTKTKLVAYKTMVMPILEYACQVWSPHNIGLKTSLEKAQRNAVKWIYHLNKTDSITDCMTNHAIPLLSDRRDAIDVTFLRKVEGGLFDIKLNTYVRFNSALHDTRGKTISWQHSCDAWTHSYFNRMRSEVKVYFPPD